MQLFIDDDPQKRFDDYLDKTYRKTASLLANSCKAVSTLEVKNSIEKISFLALSLTLYDDALNSSDALR